MTALYVPGDRPERYEKAASSGADVVIVDLEDAVGADRKDAARAAAVEWVAARPSVRVEVRVNGARTPWHQDDLDALAGLGEPIVVRLPKIESADEVRQIAARLPGTSQFSCLIETATGVLAAASIATAHARVSAVSLGEADLGGALGVSSDEGFAFARGMIVAASRAAGFGAPLASVFAQVDDEEGLLASTKRLAALGFVGRMAIHPRQVPLIRSAFQPAADVLEKAQALLREVAAAGVSDGGVILLADGRMVDPAMIGLAEQTVALATALA